MRFPSMSSLRALESAARHLSYTKAAAELNVTQSAVSHQIRHAETLWNVRLFERRGRRIALTTSGQLLTPIVRDFIEQMSTALQEIHNDEQQGSLRVTVLQSFAFKWLVPRLGHFNLQHPEIDVWLSTSEELIDFDLDKADLGIRLGRGDWPNVFAERVLKEHVFPVASRSLLDRLGLPAKANDLLSYPLLRRHSLDICPRWRDWFRDAGVNITKMPRGTQFPDTSMAVQAAIDGQGVALARSAHVGDDLAAGRLTKLFEVRSESNVAYYFVCALGQENHPPVRAFREWLTEETIIAQREFDSVANGSAAWESVR